MQLTHTTDGNCVLLSVGDVYPNGIHGAIAEYLQTDENLLVRTATLYENNLTDELLNDTDVLFWWGHLKHGEVPDELAEKVQQRVLNGMGFIVLHSGHHSKPFRKLMGTTCNLRWREDNAHERVWNVCPSHPIAKGVDLFFEIEKDEMYGELFDIPQPDELIFITWHPGGELMRSGCTFRRGNGKIFYFQPGHETYPIFYNETVRKILKNAVYWAAPEVIDAEIIKTKNSESPEKAYQNK